MYAVVETGGKQYRVSEGDVLFVEKLEGETGDSVELDKVLLISDDSDVKVGKPYLDGAKVSASIEEQGKYLDKINVLATDDAKMSDLQDTVKARVMSYLKKDYMNILFKEKFFAKCWSDLKAQFDVPKYSRIKIKDFESAIDTVKVWSPSAKYIRKEIEKYQRLQNSKKGDLLKPQVSKALDLYIEEYNKEN